MYPEEKDYPSAKYRKIVEINKNYQITKKIAFDHKGNSLVLLALWMSFLVEINMWFIEPGVKLKLPGQNFPNNSRKWKFSPDGTEQKIRWLTLHLLGGMPICESAGRVGPD